MVTITAILLHLHITLELAKALNSSKTTPCPLQRCIAHIYVLLWPSFLFLLHMNAGDSGFQRFKALVGSPTICSFRTHNLQQVSAIYWCHTVFTDQFFLE